MYVRVCVFQASEQRVGPGLGGLQVVAMSSTSGISSLAHPAFGLDISVQPPPSQMFIEPLAIEPEVSWADHRWDLRFSPAKADREGGVRGMSFTQSGPGRNAR